MNDKNTDPKKIIIGIGSLGILTTITVGALLLNNEAFMASQKENLFRKYPDLNHTNIEPTEQPTPIIPKNTQPTLFIYNPSATPRVPTPTPTKPVTPTPTRISPSPVIQNETLIQSTEEPQPTITSKPKNQRKLGKPT